MYSSGDITNDNTIFYLSTQENNKRPPAFHERNEKTQWSLRTVWILVRSISYRPVTTNFGLGSKERGSQTALYRITSRKESFSMFLCQQNLRNRRINRLQTSCSSGWKMDVVKMSKLVMRPSPSPKPNRAGQCLRWEIKSNDSMFALFHFAGVNNAAQMYHTIINYM